ncbi:protein chibby homolog 1 isoform X1 [Peromyscus eremicus]|uniref:protein chibby homolog 1 isoform X1 n=1 Tax=Peromyscus eremicus TaxID=42410 RepID=UPI0027DDB9F4|nr:protein chibby homolog 1 isoform X1 [Peromyscus eremicus]
MGGSLQKVGDSAGLRLRRRARRRKYPCFLIKSGMPLFGSIFSPKKTPPRKSASLSNLHSLDRSTRELELGLDYGTPTMNLAGQNLKFENGQWVADTVISGGVDRRETQRLRKRNQQLEEENNLLRLKVDILLDMLSETTAESNLKDKELDELKISNRRRK